MSRIFAAGLVAMGTATLGPLSAAAAEAECHANSLFHVAVANHAEDAGALFGVIDLSSRKAPGSCSFDAAKADFVLGGPGDPLWFGTLQDRFLVLTRSTGPQGDLVVYDLASRKKVLDVPADAHEIGKDGLAFWERGESATKANCPEFEANNANGFGSVIAHRKVYAFSTGRLRSTGESRCQATQ